MTLHDMHGKEMRIGKIISVVQRIKWVQMPSTSRSDLKWWPGILYDTFEEFYMDIDDEKLKSKTSVELWKNRLINGHGPKPKIALIYHGLKFHVRILIHNERKEDRIRDFFTTFTHHIKQVQAQAHSQRRSHYDFKVALDRIVIAMENELNNYPSTVLDEYTPSLEPRKEEMRVGNLISLEKRMRWVSIPTSCESDVRWWPGILYETFEEFYMDIGDEKVKAKTLVELWKNRLLGGVGPQPKIVLIYHGLNYRIRIITTHNQNIEDRIQDFYGTFCHHFDQSGDYRFTLALERVTNVLKRNIGNNIMCI